MIMKLFNLKNLLLIILFVALWYKTATYLDPDFGWRLRTGFEILNNGVPNKDIYSYTMPSFPWVDHAWLTDIIISSFYQLIGVSGLAAIFSALTVLALFVSISSEVLTKDLNSFISVKSKSLKNLWYFAMPAIIVGTAILMPFVGIRAQVITWLMLSIFLRIIFDEKLWSRLKIFTPFYFLLWANLHGGFSIGLLVLALVIFVKSIKLRKVDTVDLSLLLASALATFINPYGGGVYREIWSSVSDSSLRWQINEWQPAFMSFDIPTLSLVALFLTFITTNRNKFKTEEIIVSIFLLFEGITSVRNIPLWVFSAIPLTTRGIGYFYMVISNGGTARYKKIRVERFKKFYTLLWFYTVIVLLVETYFSYRGAEFLSESNFYPGDAINFLKNSNSNGEVFSEYGWGGYLIWKYPEKKVFIDGRMPSWKWNAVTKDESNYAMGDYINIIKGKESYQEYFDKYNIKTVLLSTHQSKDFFTAVQENLSQKYAFFNKLFSSTDTKFKLADKLASDGWKVVYQDKVSKIYKKD